MIPFSEENWFPHTTHTCRTYSYSRMSQWARPIFEDPGSRALPPTLIIQTSNPSNFRLVIFTCGGGDGFGSRSPVGLLTNTYSKKAKRLRFLSTYVRAWKESVTRRRRSRSHVRIDSYILTHITALNQSWPNFFL